MRRSLRYLVSGLTLLALGCAAEEATAPTNARNAALGTPAADRLAVMTQNFYVGADVDVILEVILTDPANIVPVLREQVQVLQNTDFPTRAGALADLLAKTRPHAVGLQEVSKIDIAIPDSGLDYHINFLPILQQVLADRNLPYVVAGQISNFTVTPQLPAGVTGVVSLNDKDVLLVDASRVTVGSPVVAKRFAYNLGPIAPGVTLRRGFVAAPVVVDGDDYVITTTHLEDDLGSIDLSQLRMAQMAEIVTVIAAAPQAVIMGDLNDTEGSAMYQVATQYGYADLWPTLRPGTTGLTCCHDSDLSDPRPDFHTRIDFIFARGFEGPPGRAMGQIDRINYGPSDKFSGPYYSLWTSDHAGLVGTLLMPQ